TCRAVFTVLPHFVLRYREMRPEVARDALLATHGGLSLELCAVICHLSPMASTVWSAPSVSTVWSRCGRAGGCHCRSTPSLPGSNREIFGAKELHFTLQWVVRCLRKRP